MSRSEDTNNEVIELLVRHYTSFIIEDKLFKALRDRGIDAVYATHNEPVRLGAFRVLLKEVYRRVHSDLYFDSSKVDLALHGILKEELKITGQGYKKSYPIGIDYVLLLEYPTRDKSKKVVVPLLVIAKSKLEEAKKVKIKNVIDKVLRLRNVPYDIRIALKNLPRFTRILLTRTVTSENEKEGCIAGEVGGIPVYSDIACGVVHTVYVDIPSKYDEVVGDSELARLTVEHWLVALIVGLSIPIQAIESPSSDPPEPPSDGGLVNNIVREIRRRAKEVIGENLEELKREAEERLQKVAEKWRFVEKRSKATKRSDDRLVSVSN